MIIPLTCPFCPPRPEGYKYKGLVKDPKHHGRWICGDCGNEQPFSPYSKTGYFPEFPAGHDILDLLPDGAHERGKPRKGKWVVEVRFYPTVEANRTDENGEPVGLNQNLDVTCYDCQEEYTVRALVPHAPRGAVYSSEKDFCKKCEGSNIDVRPNGIEPMLIEPPEITTTPNPDGASKFVRGAGKRRKGKLPG